MNWLRNTAYVLIALVALSGCSTLKGLIPSGWDSNEMLWIAEMQYDMEGIYMSAKADKLRKPYCVNKVIILTIQVDEIAEALASRRKR